VLGLWIGGWLCNGCVMVVGVMRSWVPGGEFIDEDRGWVMRATGAIGWCGGSLYRKVKWIGGFDSI